jgi:TonB family protein
VTEFYSPAEIARAAGIPVAEVVAALGQPDALVAHEDAVQLGRKLKGGWTALVPEPTAAPEPGAEEVRSLFAVYDQRAEGPARGVPLAVSSSLHAAVVGVVLFVTTLGLTPAARALDPGPRSDTRLVFIAMPGPGGGGGGGGRKERTPAPKAMREGRRAVSSPLPERVTPPSDPPPEIVKPEPPLNAEPLPTVVAPLITAPADQRDRAGVLQDARGESESRGPGTGGGAGSGSGTGLGAGDGAGVGPGSGGGTGGGPYRPGSGVQPPRLLREVRADYTDAARRSGITGDVVLEIVVRYDGSVGDVRVVRRLGGGLDERAVQAVRQWRFAPATRQGAPVDVVVEVAVEFRLR